MSNGSRTGTGRRVHHGIISLVVAALVSGCGTGSTQGGDGGGVVAGTALGIQAALTARQAQRPYANVTPPPRTPSPHIHRVALRPGQSYAPVTGGSSASVTLVQTGSVQSPRFRHRLQSSGREHLVYVINDGQANIRCTVTLYYTSLRGNQSVATSHTDTIMISPGRTNSTGVIGAVTRTGNSITPNRYTVNCV